MNLPPWVVEANKKKTEINRSFVPYEDDEVELRSMPENDVIGIDMNISLWWMHLVMPKSYSLRGRNPKGTTKGVI